MSVLIQLHGHDNVGVASMDVTPGQPLGIAGLSAAGKIPRGHKVALKPIRAGEPVIKVSAPIGAALADIAAGAHVHVHNCGFTPSASVPTAASGWVAPAPIGAVFQGYRRQSGKVGTRNYIGILTSVNCAASVAGFIARAAIEEGLLDAYPAIDGIVPVQHQTGCGMADRGEGYELLQRTLFGYAANPNFAAILMVGLGCEVLQISRFMKAAGLSHSPHFRTLTIQDQGGTRRSVADGVAILREMAPLAAAEKRETIPASELVLALQCGGSDGYSGITANPALGAAADQLVAEGGTVILSETPEIYGAEHLLMARAAAPSVATALQAKLDWWEEYCRREGAEMNNNPSPGNKAGGLTTILEKSLGAVAKGGTSPLNAVIGYAEPLTTRGLVFMDSPGFDPCSATGQIASGATIMCFTTGRGSVFGARPTPCLKLATNSDLFARMPDDMDLDCGPVIAGEPIATMGQRIFDLILRTASGAQSASEQLGFGNSEFVPWHIGAVM